MKDGEENLMRVFRIFIALLVILMILEWKGINNPVMAKSLNISFYDLWKEQQKGSYNKQLISNLKVSKTSSTLNFVNPYLGIDGEVSSEWEYNFNFAFNYMRFFNSEFRVDVFNDQIIPEKYITKEYVYGHTLDMLKQYTKLTEEEKEINGLKIRKVEYQRPKFKNIRNDLNFYTYYFIEYENSIKTFQLKTSISKKATYQKQVEDMISKLKLYPASPIADSNFKSSSKIYSDTVKLSTGKGLLNITKGKLLVGAYAKNENDFLKLSNDSGKRLSIRAFYKSITLPFDSEVNRFLKNGQIPMVSVLFERVGSNDKLVMVKTLQGDYDKSILSWANGVKKVKGSVMFRIGNEMNGNWSKWGPGNNYNDPDLYQLAFNRVYNIFKNNGVKNAKFIYNPNSQSSPKLSWNDTVMYYPGSNKTDFVGMTAYNYGTTNSKIPNTFSNVYTPIYNEMSAKFINKPLIICEIGAVEDKYAPKSQFIKDAFSIPQNKFQSVKAVVWFNQDHPPYHLKLTSSKSSYDAFKKIKSSKTIISY